MTPLYANAVLSIREHIAKRQADLDAAAAAARAAFTAALAEGLIDPSEPDWLPVQELAAATITVGRADGYPDVNIPKETQAVMLAAWHAEGISTIVGNVEFNATFSGYSFLRGNLASLWDQDYAAWIAAKEYRRDNAAAASL